MQEEGKPPPDNAQLCAFVECLIVVQLLAESGKYLD